MNKKQTICMWVGVAACSPVLFFLQNRKVTSIEFFASLKLLGLLYIYIIPIAAITAGLVYIFRREKETLKPEVKMPWRVTNREATKEMIKDILYVSLAFPLLLAIGPLVVWQICRLIALLIVLLFKVSVLIYKVLCCRIMLSLPMR